MNKSLKLNTLLNAFRMLLTVLIPLITFPYTSRIFLTEGSGQLNFASSLVQVFILFASLGIYTYGVREGAKFRNDRVSFSVFAKELLIINGVSTFITYVVFLGCVYCIPSIYEYRYLLLINGISIGFSALGFDWVYGVYEEYAYITKRQIVVQLFTIVTMFAFVHDITDIYLWAFLLVLSSTGANIFNCIKARRYIDFKFRKNEEYRLKKHIQPILVLFATQLAATVYLNIDTVLLGILSTDHHVGLYSAAVKLNIILITCFTAMMPVFVPRIVESLKDGQKEDYLILLKKVFTMIIMFALPAVVGIEMLGGELITLIAGQAFKEATATIHILAPIILIASLANIFYYNVLVPNGKEKMVLVCTLLGAVLNLALSVVLVPIYHENGAAIGSIISESLALFIVAIYVINTDNEIMKSFPKIRKYIFGSGLIVLCCFVIKFLIQNYIITILLSFVTCMFVYFVTLLITKDDAMNEILNMIKNKLVRIQSRGCK